jgi:PAS domain S-box-containing protein
MDEAIRTSEAESEMRRLRAQLEIERAAHREVEQHLRQFARAVEQSPASIVITDPEGNIEYVNTYFEQATGYTKAEALGKNPRILQSGLTPPETYRTMWSVISEGGEWRGEICNRRKNGDLYWEVAAISGLKDDSGRVSHYIAVKDEITDRKQAEARQTSLIQDLSEARLAAERASQAKGEFLANMSHEIRTPMNGVIGMTGLLLDTQLNPEQREFAGTIRTSAEALLTIINDILDFSKIESGKLDLETLDFDLQQEVESVVELLAGQAQAKGLELAFSLRSGTPTHLRGDSGRLRQVLTNLTGNAIKFTAEGEVVVSVARTSEDEERVGLRFEVRDTGPGIPADIQERLFQAFSQADASTTRKFGGTGLGLAISRQIVHLMGGAIGITSEVSKGSTFWFTLSLEKQPHDSAEAVEYGRDLSQLRALVVDDNATNRQITGHQLRAWKIYERSAASGAEALDILRDAVADGAPYDVVILDMQMPEMDGMMLARAIQQDLGLAGTRRIIMTSLGQRPSDTELKEAGVDAYLAKPIRQARLLDSLTRVMAKAAQGVPPGATGAHLRRSSVSIRRPSPQARKVRILIADDNNINRKVALGQLSRLGHTADAVASGTEVMAALRNAPYDVILMDCQMPEMDGYDTTRAIRRREAEDLGAGQPARRVHVIAMTAHAMEGDREKCLAAGMDDYISKPVRTDALQAALERCPTASALIEALEAAPVDLVRLKEMAGDDAGGQKELVDMYLVQADELIGRLHAATQAGAAPEVGRLAHQLGGASATCGMTAVVDPLRQLEHSDPGSPREVREALLSETSRQLGRIRTYLAEQLKVGMANP